MRLPARRSQQQEIQRSYWDDPWIMGGYRARRIFFQRRGALAVRVQWLWNRAPRAQLTIDVGKITLMRMQPWREAASWVTSALDNALDEVATASIRARRQHCSCTGRSPHGEAPEYCGASHTGG